MLFHCLLFIFCLYHLLQVCQYYCCSFEDSVSFSFQLFVRFFSFAFGFRQFHYDSCSCGFCCIYLDWGLQSFFNKVQCLQSIFHQPVEFLVIISLNVASTSLSFLLLGLNITYVRIFGCVLHFFSEMLRFIENQNIFYWPIVLFIKLISCWA